MSFISLIHNLTLLLVLTIPYEYILRKWGSNTRASHIVTGFLFASLTIVGMMMSVPFAPGIIFDARSVFISVGSLFGGPIVMAMTTVAAGLYRIYLGGSGLPMGLGVIASSALLGYVFYFFRKRNHNTTSPPRLLLLGVLVHLVMILWMFALPSPYSAQALADVAYRVIIVFSFGTLLLGKILDHIESKIRSETLLRQSSQQLKDSKDQLEKTLQQFQLAAETAQLGIWQLDLKTNQLNWNDHLFEIYGISKEAFTKDVNLWQSLVHPQDKAYADKRFEEILAGNDVFDVAFRIIRPDGEIRYINASGSPRFNVQKEVIGVIGINMDVTNLKKNEEKLRDRETFLRAIFDHSLNGIVVADDQGNYRSVNQAAADILGYTVDKLENMNVKELQIIQTSDVEKMYQEYIEKKREIGEFEILHPNGQKRTVQYHAVRIDTDFNLSILADITEQKRIEVETQKANKLESLGLLAGGIAHDFNNILTGVTGNLSLLQMTIDKNTEASTILAEAIDATARTRNLTQQLMTFAKGGAPITEATTIEELVQKTTQQSLRGSKTQPTFHFDNDLPAAQIDTGQISQVIQNLVINADQAMPNGGILKVSAESAQITEIHNLPLSPGQYIKLDIADQGVGIPESIINQIFDPYFTTKETGHGLGLSICHSIVKRHNGHLSVVSEIDKGTTFTIYLPTAPSQTVPSPDLTTEITQGTARILLMDDDDIIQHTVTRMLTAMGYEVEIVSDGNAALQAYQTALHAQKSFDLVIMDLTIPGGMGGKEAIDKLHVIDPNACVIVSSGYSNDPVLANPKDYGFYDAITKPIDMDMLSQTVQNALKSR